MAQAQWVANGSSGTTILLDGATVTVNASGRPAVDSTPYNSAAGCNVLINDLLQSVSDVAATWDTTTSSCRLDRTGGTSITITSNEAV